MKVATRRTISRRAACCAGWVLLGGLTGGCSSGGGATTATRSAGRSAGEVASATVTSTTRGVQLIVSGTSSEARLRAVSQDAVTAVRRVRQVWGVSALTGRVYVEVPSNDAEFRRRGGSTEAGAQIAATTTADGRVVLAPALFSRVTRQGRVVVLTHEFTHVALRRGSRTDVPRWVVEGAAEFTAYRATGLSLPELAPQLAKAVRAGRLPPGPPTDARFGSAPQAAYQEALAWCDFLVDRFELARFTRFVRSAGADHERDFRTAFGVRPSALRAPFDAFLRERMGGVPAADG